MDPLINFWEVELWSWWSDDDDDCDEKDDPGTEKEDMNFCVIPPSARLHYGTSANCEVDEKKRRKWNSREWERRERRRAFALKVDK